MKRLKTQANNGIENCIHPSVASKKHPLPSQIKARYQQQKVYKLMETQQLTIE